MAEGVQQGLGRDTLKDGKIGLVIVHAANNAFGGWKEYNQMIGMGWHDKNFGERLKFDTDGKSVSNLSRSPKFLSRQPMPIIW